MIFLAEQTSVDWWARGIGLAALVVSALALGWRIAEWWLQGHVKMKVTGTAGAISFNSDYGQLQSYRGPRQTETHIGVEFVCKGRDVTIDACGFEVLGDNRRIVLGHQRGQLPKRMTRSDKETVWATADSETQELAALNRLKPFCEDSEGRYHIGSLDEHFNHYAQRLREQLASTKKDQTA